MNTIGLIDFDGKLPNLALMKLSSFYKAQGCRVLLNTFNRSEVDHVFCSVIFPKNRHKASRLMDVYPSISFGGTGWDIGVTLPPEIDGCSPDYDLYSVADIACRIKGPFTAATRQRKAATIVSAGIGYTSRGCVRSCGFCIVPEAEGYLRQVGTIESLINPSSNVLILLDNNLTADPLCIDKLRDIKERKLIVDITQGVDIRHITPEIASALADVQHLRSIHYAWDLMSFEKSVIQGIDTLSHFIRKGKHLCFTLVGFDTTFEEDEYRFRKLLEMGVDPYIMVYNRCSDIRLHHWKRYVNGRVYKVCPDFNNYTPWQKACRAGLELFHG
jgi:hypothetical protein